MSNVMRESSFQHVRWKQSLTHVLGTAVVTDLKCEEIQMRDSQHRLVDMCVLVSCSEREGGGGLSLVEKLGSLKGNKMH